MTERQAVLLKAQKKANSTGIDQFVFYTNVADGWGSFDTIITFNATGPRHSFETLIRKVKPNKEAAERKIYEKLKKKYEGVV